MADGEAEVLPPEPQSSGEAQGEQAAVVETVGVQGPYDRSKLQRGLQKGELSKCKNVAVHWALAWAGHEERGLNRVHVLTRSGKLCGTSCIRV
jgi:hypothetical protein